MALVAAGAAGLYTHYYAAFTLLAINAAFGIWWLCKKQAASRQWRSLVMWGLGQVAIVAAFAPWLPAAWTQATTNTTFFPGRVGWQTVVSDTLRAFATGSIATSPPSAWATWSLAILIALGLLASRAPRYKLVTLAMLMAVPVAIMASLAWNKPKFAPRYLIMALPAFLLLAGAGLETLWQGRRRIPRALTTAAFVAAGGIVFATSAISLYNTYYAPELVRPDARSIANYITQYEHPGDIVILLGGYQQPVFEYYYSGGTPLVPMPPGLLPPAQQPLDYGAATTLEQAAQGKSRLWLALWQSQLADPMNVVMNELTSKAQRLGVGQEFHGMQLLLFDLNNHTPFGAKPQYALDIDYAQPLSLAGYDLTPGHASPGQTISLALYWQANAKLDENYMTFVHLSRPDGSLAAQDDHIAGADSFPSSLWQTGTLVRNTFSLTIPPDAQPGVYKIIVGLYNEEGRLNTLAGADQTILGTITILGQ